MREIYSQECLPVEAFDPQAVGMTGVPGMMPEFWKATLINSNTGVRIESGGTPAENIAILDLTDRLQETGTDHQPVGTKAVEINGSAAAGSAIDLAKFLMQGREPEGTTVAELKTNIRRDTI